MAGVDYCTVLPSWDFDKDPADVVSYFFGQECRAGSTEDEDTDFPCTSTSSVNFQKFLSLQRSEGDDREPLTISVTCKPQYRVSVCGLHVVSDTRVVELYDTSEGYLSTSRGSQLGGAQDGDGGEETQIAYRCRIRLEESQYGLSLKFPKTCNLRRLNIYQIVFILQPELDDDSHNVPSGGQVNMSKVKDYVSSMGDNLSDGARELMRNMEEYQQQRQSGLHEMMANVGGGSGQMMGLMSVFSMLGRQGQSGGSLQNGQGMRSQSEKRVPNQMSRLDRLLQESRNNSKSDVDESGDTGNSDMYNMLHDICSKVTNARKAERESETRTDGDQESDETAEKKENSSTEGQQPVEQNTHRAEADPDYSKQLQELQQNLEERMSVHVKEAEERLKCHVDAKFSELEEKICGKIDVMLQLLQKNGKPAQE